MEKKELTHTHKHEELCFAFVCACDRPHVQLFTLGVVCFLKLILRMGRPRRSCSEGRSSALPKGYWTATSPLPSPALSHSYGAQISQRQRRMRQSPTSLLLPRSYFKSIVEGHNGRLAAFHFSRQQVGGSLPAVCNNANGRRMNSVGCAK